MSKERPLKRQVCITCKRVLEPVKTQWAAGPVCYPCFWAAKFYYENGYAEFQQIPSDFANMLGNLFIKNGYLWPDDLIEAFRTESFKKASVMLRRWWSPKFFVEDELDLAEGTEYSLAKPMLK
ncbi:MAG: hypothetical protein V3U84_00700 [Thiotrichaceae bacterium]